MIEKKVKASSAAALVSGIVVWALSRWVFKGAIPDGYVTGINAVVPAIFAAVAGYLAPHTARPPAAYPAAAVTAPPPESHP